MKDDTLELALKFTLRWEGLYSCNPADPGGATMKGVTQNVYNSYRAKKGLPVQGVKAISDSEVRDIYENLYWKAAGCDTMKDPKLAIAMFDFAVNGGVSRAKKYLALSSDWKTFNANRLSYYSKIIVVNPKLTVFLKGWTNRTNSLTDYLNTL